MRSVFMMGLTLLFIAASAGHGAAVGERAVGREECQCCPLTAKGITPDALNQLKEASGWRFAVFFVDKIAFEIRNMLSQIGVPPRLARLEVEIPDPPAPKRAAAKGLVQKKKLKSKIKIPPKAK